MLPANWDGLIQVKSKKLEFVYLLPNADFRPYSKIEYDPVEISMRKNWLRDYNTSSVGEGSVIRESDVREMLTKALGEFDKYFAQEFTTAGYAIVTAPAADVLRVSVEVLNLDVSAPDTSVGIQRTFTADAGQAALLIEVRDSVSNQLLGRAVDRKLAGDEGPMMRTSASNWGDFENIQRPRTDRTEILVAGGSERPSEEIESGPATSGYEGARRDHPRGRSFRNRTGYPHSTIYPFCVW
jgi:Protein of unknown function (DUF3313)